MSEPSLHTARILSSIAATCIALACGSNYVYSTWGPQFADKLRLSTTQSNLIGSFGNFGMYAIGMPLGILIDFKGPRPSVLIGVVMLAAGYFPLYHAYDSGLGSVFLFCVFSFMTGLGSCAAFNASIKASAINWPHNRGMATGFPLAAFGLSAFFFSATGQLLVPGNTGNFLLLLACGTSGMVLVGFFFLKVFPRPHYSQTPREGLFVSFQLRRTKSEEHKYRAERAHVEPGRSPSTNTTPNEREVSNQVDGNQLEEALEEVNSEISSLLTTTSISVHSKEQNGVKDRAHRVDIRGIQMFRQLEFWQLFAILGLMSGIGLMTINNIGHSVNALWQHYDDSASRDFVGRQQALQVSALSVGSFSGRLASGFASDFLVKTLHASRLWCVVACTLISLAGQLAGYNISNPNILIFVSILNGVAYGVLFGCYPSVTAETFGIHGLATNWGCMTLAPVIWGNIFNIYYGKLFDWHSIVMEDGERVCPDGLYCYRSAYALTCFAAILGLALTLWTIHYQHRQRLKEDLKKEVED